MSCQSCQSVACMLILLVPALSSAGEQAHPENPFAAPILDVHPRVFIRSDGFDGLTVAKLRQAVRSPEYSFIRSKWRRKPLGRAILWMIDGRPADLEAAVAGLEKMKPGQGSWSDRGKNLVMLATLFDWLHDQLDATTRKRVIQRIEREADAAVQHIRRGQAPFYYSRTPGALAGMTISGIALHGVSPKADTYLKLFREWGVAEYFKAYDWVDGAATGSTYTMNYTYIDLPHICAAWWSATGKNPTDWIRAEQGDWLNDIVHFYSWYMRPSFAFTDINDQFRGNWNSHDEFCQGLDIASYVTRNGYGRAWSRRWLARFGPSLYHTEYAHNFIFRDVTLRPEPLDALPHAALFGRDSCGYGFFRSDWPRPMQPDTATHVFFRCGDPMNVHGGVAAGEFQIFKYAPLAARSGRYGHYDSPADQYHRNCISTNVVLFTDPSNEDDRGDQQTRKGLKNDHATWDQWLAIRKRFNHDVATITDWQVSDRPSQDRPAYSPDATGTVASRRSGTPSKGAARCRADLTRTNPKAKCRKWIREFVWLADRHLIVLDIVQTASPAIKIRWQLHAPTVPEIGDHRFTIMNQAPDKKWANPSLQPKNNRGKLFCQTLAPKQYAVILHGEGRAKTLAANGSPRTSVPGNQYHDQYGSHVIQLDPGDASRGIVFLHVLTATDAGETVPPKATYRVVERGRVEVNVDGATTMLSVPEWFKEK